MNGKCKENVSDHTGFYFYPCSRKAWKDGYCKQHHPESVKARQEKSETLYREKLKNSPWTIAKNLTAENAALKERVRELEGVVSQIYNDLPTNRDWLNPDLEREIKAVAQDTK